MSRVSVSDLKAQLSRYLREVRRGGEVEVLDRGVPVARLIGIAELDQQGGDERRERLVRSGVVRAGTGDASPILDRPFLEIPGGLLDALDQERRDRL
ncbi:MAG TPA: type II toxin-antitoxin system prevent-host-death family antitoxin [Thermoanaerobaculia bacterium]|nr:type II toxin-antitoxin system prevent-host-death family antitoxin [Thermoanaerobaculia bacterium]